ncbi:MAG: hypothetical protein HW419_1696 [Deltaproteobacteria bacterium]|nr:hypothetical protein [Deltaproteobacteria bacterium]
MTSYGVFIFATLISGLVSFIPIAAAQPARPVEMKVRNLVIDPNTNTPVVLLEAVSDKQLLPIWIDVPEARAISLEIDQVKPPRPLTHWARRCGGSRSPICEIAPISQPFH